MLKVLFITFIEVVSILPANSNRPYILNQSSQIILNNERVRDFLDEFIYEAESKGLNVLEKLNALEFIIVEPEGTTNSKLEKMELGKIVNGNGILISQICLLDSMMLRITLYRELCHFLGVPYIDEGPQIMSLKKPDAYSYGVFYDDIIKKVEYDTLFNQLKLALEKKN